MRKITVPILITALLMFLTFSTSVYAADESLETATTVGVEYKTHVQDKGWEANWVTDGGISGTVGEGKRLEALKVQLYGSVPANANIVAYVHVQNRGNLGPFSMGNLAGTEGQGLRLESIRLVLNSMPGYTIKYDVQVQNKGWLKDENDVTTWFGSGATAGTVGEGLRLEGIKIKLVEINEELQSYYAVLNSVSQYDYTTDSWADYQAIVDENVVDESNTKTEIKAATDAIKAAQSNLVKGKVMSGYYKLLQSVNEVDYTPETWAAYQEVVNENVVTQDDSQSVINKATLNILAAQKLLQHKVNLTEYRTALSAVREADYTTSSWAGYQSVLASNVMSESNSQVEVDAATDKIKLAQRKMVRKFDFTAYNALLAAVKEEDYLESTWAVYQTVIDNNLVDENDTQTDVENAIKLIEEAQKNLVKKADLRYYQAALDAVQKDDYTTASWDVYQKEIQTIIVNITSDQEVVDAAIVNILKAQKNLILAGDMTYYEEALNAVDKNDYTSASWATYQKVVDANVVIPTDGQEAINLAIQNIEAAQKKLVKGADLTEYKELLGAINSDDYTSASWIKYEKALKSNLMNGDKTQAVVDAAILKIKQAQADLELKGDLNLPGGYNETIAEKKEIEYTSTSWTIYQKILDSNYMDADKSQSQIDTAVRNIKKGQLKLTKAGDLTAYLHLMEYNKNRNDIAMVEGEYTSASWTIYQKILDKNEMNRDKSQQQIDAAVVAIERAQKNLKVKGDMTQYNTVLAQVKEADWTVASWTAYMKVVMSKDNYMTGDNDEASIKRAIGNINLAQTTILKKKGNVDDYNKLITKYVGQQDRFTTKGWNAYMAVLTKNMMTTENTQDQIQSAITFITFAQEELLKNPAASLLEYNRILGLVDDESAYTPESWATYAEIVRKYQNITKDSLQTDVDKATAALVNAQKNLVRQNGTELKAFQKMLELYQNNFRSSSGNFYNIKDSISNWSVYEQAVLKYADFYPEDYTWKPSNITKESSPTEIVAATNAIEAAIRALRPNSSMGLDTAIANYETAKAAAIPWNDAFAASQYTKSSFEAYAAACTTNDLMNLIISSNGTLITVDIINTATNGINNAMSNKKPVYRATDGDIQKFQAEKSWYAEFKTSYYTVALWKDYESKITTTYFDLDHPEEIVQDKIVSDTNSIISKREALIYNANYVMEQARITAANLGSFSVGGSPNNIITRTEALMTGTNLENFKITNYKVTFEQLTDAGKGTAVITSDGTITNKGDGKATVKISIQAQGDPLSTEIKTTGELTLTILD